MDNQGALVGWHHQDLGDRVLLALQTRQRAGDPDDFDVLRVLMTKNQAAVLGNYLFQVSGQTPPSADERSWFRRMFG
ncbi:hypothetical protein GRI75_12860 [Altererythrobacter soli]|uniref:Uncharacterized protein n=1 Tax=Croceibacterium soli TaxID=1739690 RepID=A0A6I4UUS9_9SPHN|nr:hypothetical protein [Croceibacterium soli]MXP42531.1 hypothetical protein [Croceibacterium soli]